jgi:dUTP pyrophosphatase
MMTYYPTIPTVLKDGTEPISYAHEGDAGLDLCATEDVTLYPGQWQMVGSGVSMAIPKGFVGIVTPRSGLGCKGLVLKNTVGIIDAGYRGEVGVILANFGDAPFVVEKGMKVAQIVVAHVEQAEIEEVQETDDTDRGAGGFGSTGL